MKWNLRLAAAQRGIWKASDLQRTLAEHGLVISAGKMSGLWSGQPASIKLDDLDIICAAIGCTVTDLLIAEPEKVTKPITGQGKSPSAASAPPPPWCHNAATDVHYHRPDAAHFAAAGALPTLSGLGHRW